MSLGSYYYEDIALGAIGVSHLKAKPSDLGVLFEDEDGEVLDVKVENSNPEVASVEDDDTKFNIRATAYGITTISVTATDGLGEKASFSFRIAVKDQSKGMDAEVFPEVATDVINIWPAAQLIQKYYIKVYSAGGAKVLDITARGSLFQPIEVDITGIAPGVYTAHVTAQGGSSQKLKFVKY